MTTTTETMTCPPWCVHDIVDAGESTWHHAAPVTVQMSRNGRLDGPPAVLELELSFLDLTKPLLPDLNETPEILVRGDDGSGSLVQLCLSVEDVESVAGEMLRLARAAKATRHDHQPWCAAHEYGEDHGGIVEWGCCSTGTQDVGGVLVDANDGSLSGAAEVCIGTDGLTIEQGRELARTIVALCDTLVPGVSATLSQSRGRGH